MKNFVLLVIILGTATLMSCEKCQECTAVEPQTGVAVQSEEFCGSRRIVNTAVDDYVANLNAYNVTCIDK